MHWQNRIEDVVIVGAGASGIGMAMVLRKLGIDYLVLEKDTVGASFKNWPKETRFISPSFTGNFFKMPDLNAISPETSPAHHLLTEHPTGMEFGSYLERIAEFYRLRVKTGVKVTSLEMEGDLLVLNTEKGEYPARHVIWAAGEYQYPKTRSFQGEALCRHYSQIPSFSEITGKDQIIIGAYESGFDAAYHLVKQGKNVSLLDSANYLNLINSDSSYSLSPFTRDRIKEVLKNIEYRTNSRVERVEYSQGEYTVTTENGDTLNSSSQPIACTGFDSSLSLVKSKFHFKDGYPMLSPFDESTKTSNLFLVGPRVKHKKALFCFIYKYRQRFAIVGERIARNLKLSAKAIKAFIQDQKDYNFYLEDLSCCDNECTC